MRIFITGSEGFLGSCLSSRIQKAGHAICGFDKRLSPSMDILSPDSVTDRLEEFQPDVVLHLAANASPRTGIENPSYDLSVNTIGTLNMLKGICTLKVKPYFLFTSSAYVYGDHPPVPVREDFPPTPSSPYGISKLASELYIKYYSKHERLKYTILRLFNMYGPGQEKGYAIPDLIQKVQSIQDKGTIAMRGHPDDARDFVNIEDAINLFMKAIEKRPENTVLNVGSGIPTKIRDLVSVISNAFGLRDVRCQYDGLSKEPSVSYADRGKAYEELGWHPNIPVEEGVRTLVSRDKSL